MLTEKKMTGYPIDKLQLSVRAKNVLHRMSIHSVDQLMASSIDVIANQRNIGVKTIAEISEILRKVNAGEVNIDSYNQSTETLLLEKLEFTDDQLTELSCHSISELRLSVRSYNILIKSRIMTLDKVAVLTENEIADLKGMGAKSRTDILDAMTEWLHKNHLFPQMSDDTNNQEVACEIKEYYQELEKMLEPIGHIYWKQLLQYSDAANFSERILYGGTDVINSDNIIALLELPELQLILKKFFLNVTSKGIIKISEFEDAVNAVGIEFNKDILLDKFYEGTICMVKGDYCFVNRKSVLEYLSSISKSNTFDREIDIINMRLSGENLQSIGDRYDLTRERIRQILKKTVSKFPPLYDDFYSEPYCYFDFSKNSFCDAFPSCGVAGYEYLSIRYQKGNIEITNDTLKQYTGVFAEQLSTYIQEEANRQDKKTVSKTEMIYRILVSNSDKPMSMDEFETEYYSYIERKGFSRERLVLNMRTVMNHMRNAKHIVFNKENYVRYCDADAEQIWKRIDFSAYKNLVISSELIYRDYEELMMELDIRDGYELFCLIKTSLEYWDSTHYEINCRRIPIMIMGDGLEERQSVQLLKEISPVGYSDYFVAYEERFGSRKESVPGNSTIISALMPYYIDGQFVIDVPAIDDRDVEPFKIELAKKKFWFIDDIEKLFSQVCIHSSRDALNTAAFNRIDYSLNAGYAYSNKYGTVSNYFDVEVFSSDIVDLSILDRRMNNLSIFASSLYKKKKSLDYIETAPKVLVSMRYIKEQYGISKGEIYELQKALSPFYEDAYFNAHSLWNEIYNIQTVRKLQNNKWMCTSIMRQQEMIYSLSVAGNIILSKDYSSLNIDKICEWIVSQHEIMSIHKLTYYFNEKFGSNISHYKIAEKLKSTEKWEHLVTDSLDEYINSLLVTNDMNMDNLLQEEFF